LGLIFTEVLVVSDVDFDVVLNFTNYRVAKLVFVDWIFNDQLGFGLSFQLLSTVS